MAEKKCQMDRLYEIPVWVDDTQKWLSGLSKRTTCDDIIYAILFNENRHETENTDSYAIFERWKGVEKDLQGRTKILRVWRNWGSEQSSVKFIMRRIDDIVPAGEYMSTKRRFKKWRHRRRYEHCLSQQSTYQEHCYDCKTQNKNSPSGQCYSCQYGFEKGLGLTKNGDALDHDKLRRLQKMIRSVMMQEKKIKSMANRLEETELLIGKYEAKIHFHRTRKKGVNYVQRSLLHDSTSTSEDSLEDFISKANINHLEEYVETCDRLINVWESLIAEENTIENILSLIRQYGIEPCPALTESDQNCSCERTADRGSRPGSAVNEDCWMLPCDMSGSALGNATDPEFEALNSEFNRVMTVSVIQNITSEQLDKEMEKYDKQKDEKCCLIASLENELRLTELEQPDSGGHFASLVSVPEKSGVPMLDIENDWQIRVKDSRGRSSSLGTCPSLEVSEKEGCVENMVRNIEKRKENEEGNLALSNLIMNSSPSKESSSETISLDSQTENHLEITSNGTDDNCPVNNTTTTNTTNDIIITNENNDNKKIANRKGPRIGIVGGASRSDFARTKSKRDWLSLLPSLDKIGTQEKVTLNSDLSQTETSISPSDTKSKTDKDTENEIDETPTRVNQRQLPFIRQLQTTQEREPTANSLLSPPLLDNSQLLLTPDNSSTIPCPVFKLDKSDDTDSTSDTGLGSMNSDEFNNSPMETLV